MPREVQSQSDQHAHSPHLEDLPDSAYNSGESYRNERDPHGHNRDFSWGHNAYEPSHADEYAHEHNSPDEESGYNWGPPPHETSIPDPGFSEHEVDIHPHG